MYEPDPSTPEGVTTISEEKSGKSKGENVREEHWLELPQHKGTGGSNNQLHEMNGTVEMERSAIKLSMPEKTPEKPWANQFATDRMAARGMNLTYIAPIIVDGEKVVEILAEDVAEDDVKWKPLVVVYMVKLPNLPLNCWNYVVLSKIGSSLGKPLYANECTTQTSKISFARILVEMDITRILPTVNKIQDPKGRILEQKIRSTTTKKKGQGQGQRKEWKPTAKEGKEPDKENDQQITTTNESQDQEEWQTVLRMPPVQVMVMEPLFSYYSPLSIELESRRDIRKKPFRFYNCLAKHPDFKTIIHASWKRQNGGMQGVWQTLKAGTKAHNQITMLTKEDGTIIRDLDDITKEVVEFYKGLLGQSTSPMPAIKPAVAGGLNVTDVYVWNKAAILKYLWDLSKKKDKLWIVWIYTYDIKDRRPWEVQVKQASWVVRKILQAGHWIS
ncbi:hypothetical protein H5410_014976 [Solanum commersonii]|uniref:DUF4283 domain-containing protein n=1 Tax=Solanum commersonii TaxID=4109 RepID=A0A9J5ZSJ4_SOLCO|nr:hypothetical protein H5410_014976 [Solanum commersonii]